MLSVKRSNCKNSMSPVSFSLREDYWETFELQDEDNEFLYNYLLEAETPLTPSELVSLIVNERIRIEKQLLEKRYISGGDLFQPKGSYEVGQSLVFPAADWEQGEVIGVRRGQNPDLKEFQVIKVAFESGVQREYAAGLMDHKLNEPLQLAMDDPSLDVKNVLETYGEDLIEELEEELGRNEGFVKIAGKWFPRALLVDVNIGHLNLAEAVLDMASGGPLPTGALLEQIGLTGETNSKLAEFSVDLALQEDPRFDEVGPAGQTLWFLNRLEPPEVLEPPIFLRYSGIEYDRSLLNKEMLALEREIDDELSPLQGKYPTLEEMEICLIYPHWRSGTLPLNSKARNLFPTAYESPRIQCTLVDGDTGERYPGWVVREKRYVYGLKEWYQKRGFMPGSVIRVRRSKKPGEMIVQAEGKRSSRDWLRTVLVGSDGGIVFAMLKQLITGSIDERMAIAVPDWEAVDQVWSRSHRDQSTFEKQIISITRELAKLNPQSHVHASELYAAFNVIRRCPPGPILATLAANPLFVHVGDLHYRLGDSDNL